MASIEFLTPTRFRASFGDPDTLLAAVLRLKGEGHRILDTYTPFPVHGMDEALGQQPSRLPRACLGFGLLGLLIALGVQVWTSAFDYPLRIGGKPLAAIPAFIPVAFELTVLLAGLGVVASLFVVSGLRPKFRVPNLHPGANDDRFIVAGEVKAGSSLESVRKALADLSPSEFSTLVDDRLLRGPSFWDRDVHPATLALFFVPAGLVLALLGPLNRNFLHRNPSWDGGMMHPVAYQAFDAHPHLPRGQVLQTPPVGTVPRSGLRPLAFKAGKEEAERAGRELANPLAPTQANFARGKLVYERSCAACHGRDGDNNSSAIVAKGLLAPTILVTPVVKAMPDGQIFHIATFGGPKQMKGLGDLISRDDRWKVVLYVRELQKAAAPKPVPAQAPTPGVKP